MSLVVGLTGGIASGKSTVANMLKELDITIIDADVEARLAVEKGLPAYLKIVSEFGQDILLEENGEIDRKKLGEVIFHNTEKRLILNEIVHPEVRRRMKRKMEESIQNREECVVLDIPLLFESKLSQMVEKTILVYVDRDIQLKRLMKRNDLSLKEAEARVKSQMPLSEKVKLADAVINNNGSIKETKKQLIEILASWGVSLV